MICVLIPSNLSNPLYLSHSGPSHRGAEATATHGAPELSKGLLGGTCGVEALGQQHDAVEEEKGGQTVDDILEILNTRKREEIEIDNNQDLKRCQNTISSQRNPTARLKGCPIWCLHVGQGDVVLHVAGKVVLDESLGLREGLVPAAAEEGDARETQERGDQGAVRHATQTAHTAVIATYQTRHSSMKVRAHHQLMRCDSRRRRLRATNTAVYLELSCLILSTYAHVTCEMVCSTRLDVC